MTVSGFASTVTSAAGGQRASRRASARGPVKRRRAAAEEDRLDLVREQAALQLELGEQRVDVARRARPVVPTSVTKSQ